MNPKEYIAYEYQELTVERADAPFLRDSYENFGWEIAERPIENRAGSPAEKIMLQMKRNRNLMNRTELTRLQRHFEACLQDISEMEKQKERRATILAITVGIIGTACLAVSVMAFTASPPIYWLHLLTAIPGVLGWILPYFLYKREREKQTQKLNPLIEQKKDELYKICEKGHHLLNI